MRTGSQDDANVKAHGTLKPDGRGSPAHTGTGEGPGDKVGERGKDGAVGGDEGVKEMASSRRLLLLSVRQYGSSSCDATRSKP